MASLFDKKNTQAGEQTRRRRLSLEWLEERLAPAIDYWTGAVDNKWATAGNWSRNNVPQVPQAGDDLVFGDKVGTQTTVNRNTNDNLPGLSVNSVTISAAGYTLGGANGALGSLLTLNSGGGGFTVASGLGVENLALDLQLGTNPPSITGFSFNVNAASTLNVTGRLSGSANSTLQKVGAGTMILNADNSTANGGLNGAISIQAGVVIMTNAKALGTTVGGTTVATNAQLQIQSGATGFTITEALDINGPGLTNTGALYNQAGNNTWAGTIVLDSDSYIGAFNGTTLTIAGQISDLGSGHNLDKVGSGEVVFSRVGGNTYRGITTIQDGILSIQDPLSLGASGTPGSGTVVGYNAAAGQAGTLQLDFHTVGGNNAGGVDPNGVLTDPTKPFSALTNPYIGFQVFDEQLTLNGPGFTIPSAFDTAGLGALYNVNGKNQWNGPVFLGSTVANSSLVTEINIGVAAPAAGQNTDLTISGVISDPNNPVDPNSLTNPPAKVAPDLEKIFGGRLILNNNNTFHGKLEIVAGILTASDSHALGKTTKEAIAGDNTPGGNVTVDTRGALEMAVDSGLDGTALMTHGRNLGFDSAPLTAANPNGSNGPGQELFFKPGTIISTATPTPPSAKFTLTFKGNTTPVGGLDFSSPTLAADIQTRLNALVSVQVIGGVTVTQSGNLFRIAYNNIAQASASQIPLITFAATDPTAITVNPIYGLNIAKDLVLNGGGVAATGALRSVSGINIYSGSVTLAHGVSLISSIGVDADSRAGHPTADASYFTKDWSLTVNGGITDPLVIDPITKLLVRAPLAPLTSTTLAKTGTGDLILQTANSYWGQTIVQQGWVTAQNSLSLGVRTSAQVDRFGNLLFATVGDTVQPPVIVEAGAALHLKALVSGANLTIDKNLVLSGNGITTTYAAINQEGALLNLGGVNSVTGNVALVNNAGIGVQNLDPTPSVNPSQLTLSGSVYEYQPPPITLIYAQSGGEGTDANLVDTGSPGGTLTLHFDPLQIPDQLRVYYGPLGTPGSTILLDTGLISDNLANPNGYNYTISYPGTSTSTGTQLEIAVDEGGSLTGTAWNYTGSITPNALVNSAGITKFGTGRLVLEGGGTYSAGTVVKEGTLSVRNDTALGQQTSGTQGGQESFTQTNTTVQSGATLELGDNIPSNYGGLQAGVQVANEHLFLNSSGQQIGVAGISGKFTLTFNGATTVPLDINDPTLAKDMAAALNVLPTIGGATGGSVTVTKTGYIYTVIFGGTLAGLNNPLLVANRVATPATVANDAEITIIGSTAPLITESDDGLSKDIAWRGPVTLSTNTVIDVGPNSRLTLDGVIDDSSNTATGGSSLTKRNNGELVLSGANSYRGTTFVTAGIVTVANSQGLGTAGGVQQSVQQITLTGDYQFTLSVNGQQTTILDTRDHVNPGNFAAEITAALNALPAVNGRGGSAAVVSTTPLGNVFQVTFTGGSLLGTDPVLTVNVLTTTSTPPAGRNPNAGSTGTVTAIATGSGGTIVSGGGQLQLRGNLNITGESLVLAGIGVGSTNSVGGVSNAPTNIPVRWFGVGPAPINNGLTAGNEATSGRVTGVSIDPTDSKVMYLSSAGGGAWKTIDGGKTWTQLFDGISATQSYTVTGTSGTYTLSYTNNAGVTDTTGPLPYNATPEQVQAALNGLKSIMGVNQLPVGSVTVTLTGSTYTVTFSGGYLAGIAQTNQLTAAGTGGTTVGPVASTNPISASFALYSGSIAVAPSDPRIVYLGTGEANNSYDSFYGTGVYKSTDSGRTWHLMTDASGNPLYGLSVTKIVVDPFDANIIYVATSDQATNRPASATSIPGVYRFSDKAGATTAANSWFNLTGVVSNYRATLNGSQSAPPGSAGPDDDFRLTFGQRNNSWSDLSLVYFDTSPKNPGDNPNVPVLYAAQGTASGITSSDDEPSNAVYRTENPTADTPTWFVGTPGAAQNEIQTITVNVPNGGRPGQFQLSFRGSGASRVINFFDPRVLQGQIQSALDGLSTIGPNTVVVTLAPGGTINTQTYIVTFQNAAGNSVLGFSPQPLIKLASFLGAPDSVVIAETQAGGGADTETGTEFPAGAYVEPPGALPNQPRNGVIKFTTYVDPAVVDEPPGAFNPDGPLNNPVFAQVTLYATVTFPTSFNPTTGQRWYPNTYGQFEDLLKSSDGGRTWADVTTQPPNYQGTVPFARGVYDTAILATSASHVYVAGTVTGATANKGFVYENTTGGTGAWTDISVDSSGNGPHTDGHAFTVDGSGNVILSTDGGVWRLDPGTHLWTDINGTLAITQFNGVSQNPFNSRTILGGAQNNGTVLTTDGVTWNTTDGSNTGLVRYDPNNPLIAYHVINGKLAKSTDGGQTWTTVYTVTGSPAVIPFFGINGVSSDGYFPLVVDAISSRVVIGGPSLQESLDQANTWNPNLGSTIGKAIPGFGGFNVVAIATYQGNRPDGSFQQDPGFTNIVDRGANTYDPNTFYVSDGSSIGVTKDHGASWQDRSDAAFSGSIKDIVVDPRNRDTAYFTSDDPAGTNAGAAGKGRVFMTTNAGVSWTDITGNLPDIPSFKLVVDPRTGTVYLGNDNGVYALTQVPVSPAPAVWQRFGSGLPEVAVTDLDLNLTLNTLTAGTYGRSAFQAFLGEVVSDSGALRVVSGSSTWNGPVAFSADTTVTVDGTQYLQNGAGFARLDILGVVSDLVPGANNHFTKDGLGDLVLSGANTYGGLTEVKNGILIVNNPQALGAFNNTGGTITAQQGTIVDQNATLELETDLPGESVVLGANGVDNTGNVIGGASGNGALPGLNGHNVGGLRNISSGNRPNTFSGTLMLAANSTVGVDSNSQLNVTGKIIEIGGSFGLTKELTGTLDLAAADTFTGATTVNQGILGVQNSTALGLGSAAATVLDGAQLQLQGTGLQIAQGLVLSGTGIGILGSGALLNTGGNNQVNGNIVFTALPNFSPFTTPAGVVAIGANAGTKLTLAGTISEASTGSPSVVQTTGLSKIGQGTVILQGNNTYTGSTYVSQGILDAQNSGALGARGTTPAGLGAVQRIVTLDQTPAPGAIDPVTGLPVDQFTVGVNGFGTTQIFPGTLPYGSTAAAVQSALNALLTSAGYSATAGAPNQLQVTVTRSDIQTTVQAIAPNVNGAGQAKTGYLYNVTFTGTLATTNVPQISAFGVGGVTAAASKVADAGVGTLVANGAELDIDGTNGAVTTPAAMEIALNGAGFNGTGALHNIVGNNTVQGNIDLQTNSTIDVNAGTTLALTGTGGGAGANLTKIDAGTLQVDGNFGNFFTVNNVVMSDINFLLDGGVLSGNGSTGDITAMLGTIHAGTLDNGAGAVGTLTTGVNGTPHSGNVGLTANDQVFADLGHIGDATPNNLLMVNGSITLSNPDGSNAASLIGALASGPRTIGDTFTIIQTDYFSDPNAQDTVNGVFAGPSTATVEPGSLRATLATIGNTQYRVEYFVDHVDVTQVADSTSTAVTSSADPSVYGQPVTFTATVSFTGTGTPTGTVTFYDNGVALSGAIALANGMASYTTTTPLTVGAHPITAVYTSDTPGTYPNSSSMALSQVVNQDPTTTTLTTSTSTVSQGQNVTFTATVASQAPGSGQPTGFVDFFDGTTNISGDIAASSPGVYTYSTQTLGVGAHTITAVYNQPVAAGAFVDPNYLTSTSNAKNVNVVAKQPTATTVTSSKNPSTVGDLVTFTATVTNTGTNQGFTPGGAVDFFDTTTNTDLGFGTSIGNNMWTYSTSGLAQGTHTITATYQGDANFNASGASSGSVNQIVNGVIGSNATKTTVTSSGSPSFVGQPVTFTATVTSTFAGTPTGSVIFKDGANTLGTGTPIGGGKFTFTTSTLAQGPHSITAAYQGDANYAPSTSPAITQVVSATGTTAATISPVSSSVNPSLVGQAVTFSVSVKGGTTPQNTGSVTFLDNGASIGTGTYNATTQTWQLTTSSLAVGNHTITATFSGNANYAAGTSSGPDLVQVVKNVGTATPTIGTPTSSANPSSAGQAVTFSVSVKGGTTPQSTGSVTFFDNGVSLGAATYNASTQTWQLTTSALTIGSHAITATFSGNINYAAGTSGTLTQVVKAATTTSLASSGNPVIVGTPVTFTATISSPSGVPTGAGTVNFYDGNTFIGTGTYIGNGQWRLTTSSLAVGIHTIRANYLGDNTFAGSSATLSQAINPKKGRGN